MDPSPQLLKDCIPPEPLSGGREDKLCTIGFLLNLQHAEAQSRETAADADMDEASDTASRLEQFGRLKAAVVERHEIMREQFSHVKDCFVCSVAFGLTPAPDVRPDRGPFVDLLARFKNTGLLSKMKAGLQRI
jgi:hypothetical protein